MTKIDELLTVKEVMGRMKITRSVFYRITKEADFPKKIEFTKRSIRYRKSEIDAWVRSKHQKPNHLH